MKIGRRRRARRTGEERAFLAVMMATLGVVLLAVAAIGAAQGINREASLALSLVVALGGVAALGALTLRMIESEED